MARCPAHQDRNPSLSLRDTPEGIVLVHCHAGCPQATVINALRQCGLWDGRARLPSPGVSRPTLGIETGTANAEFALRLWQASAPAGGSPVQGYLQARGITQHLPSSLRFDGALRHPSGDTWPAMVALVTHGLDDARTAVHRTFLARDASGKAPIHPQKMMLGPCHGGAVRLAEASGILMVGEGIETCLSAMQAVNLPAWAALSAPGIRALVLPQTVKEVIILADADAPGQAAAKEAARRWVKEGRIVRIAQPGLGLDFNDVLLSQVVGEDLR